MKQPAILLALFSLFASSPLLAAPPEPPPPDPRYFVTPRPDSYPGAAVAQRAEGLVVLRVYFPKAGRPLKVEIHRSSGFPVLDEFAARWAREQYRSRDLPAAPPKPVDVPVRFTLR